MATNKKNSSRPTPSKQNLELAERVQIWGLLHEFEDFSRLNDLVSDLEQSRNWNYWSSCRPEELLPEPPLKGTNLLRNRYRRILFLRNLLVFLPVTITWIAISEASSSFSEFVSDNESSVVNFLQFWQDGYGYLDPIWRLSSIALIDFLILSLIMVLTIVLQLVSNRTAVVEKSERLATQAERNSLIRDLFEFFARNQKVTSLTLDRTMATALRDLSKSTQNLERLTKELGKSVKGFPSYLSILKEIKSLDKAVNRLQRKDD